jgi:hypothetical protein
MNDEQWLIENGWVNNPDVFYWTHGEQRYDDHFPAAIEKEFDLRPGWVAWTKGSRETVRFETVQAAAAYALLGGAQ